jgi:hypothetical protein
MTIGYCATLFLLPLGLIPALITVRLLLEESFGVFLMWDNSSKVTWKLKDMIDLVVSVYFYYGAVPDDNVSI